MKTPFYFLIVLTLACTSKEAGHVDLPTPEHAKPLPAAVVEGIQKEFPGAVPYGVAIDSILARLKRIGISSEDILWGQSTCVDDITNTKNKIIHPEIKGPFTFGGLGGLPFTGVTGLDAFAHHVPEDGAALLFLGPHIGYREGEGWGKILRHGQEHASTCCGALYAAVDKLKKDEIEVTSPTEDDYQEQIIEQLALAHKNEILSAKEPLVEFTRVVHREAEERMSKYTGKVKERHFAYGVVIVGVIINTDYMYDDYLWIDRIAVKDIKTNTWLKELKP